jgi:aminoglycoside phosphotransferase (APT) family kinase protein
MRERKPAAPGRSGTRTGTGPPARGVRVAWDTLPASIRTGVERICGAPVLRADSQPGGFSPGVAARLTCADGSRWFVRVVSADTNAVSPDMHRREAGILRALDPFIAAGQLAAPRLRDTLDQPPWMVLVLADVDGEHPALPWQAAELTAVLAALDDMARALTPSPIAITSLAEQFGEAFTGWQRLAAAPSQDQDRLDAWSRDRLDLLAGLERSWPAHAAGDTLVHADIRADNVLLTCAGAVIVDWPHACVGAAFADLVFLAPSVAMQGGPAPAELLRMTKAGRAADRDAVTATVCALAGFFTERSLQPPPPGIPTVREFQAAQGDVARRWLATLL